MFASAQIATLPPSNPLAPRSSHPAQAQNTSGRRRGVKEEAIAEKMCAQASEITQLGRKQKRAQRVLYLPQNGNSFRRLKRREPHGPQRGPRCACRRPFNATRRRKQRSFDATRTLG